MIGLTIAWRAAQRGLDVLVLERDGCAHGATRAAAGMLAPIAEIDFGTAGESLLALGLESATAWPAFADELAAAIGEPSRLRPAGTRHQTAVAVGRQPTFIESRPYSLVEAHLLDFQGDLYDEMGTVELVSQLRGQVKFVSVDALVDQMTVDVAQTRRALAGASPV